MDRGVEEPLAAALDVLAVAEILGDVGDHPGIENALAIGSGIKAAVEIDIRGYVRSRCISRARHMHAYAASQIMPRKA